MKHGRRPTRAQKMQLQKFNLSMVIIKLKDLIESKSLSQRVLSQEAGIRSATINHMCNNVSQYINITHLDSICRALNCKIEDIVEYIPDEDILK